ncbi:MAG TPA: HlyD family efflux transporter periplasmic adaptor subunit [Actinomycetes bacterium]|jgi:HlyD family secretion protein
MVPGLALRRLVVARRGVLVLALCVALVLMAASAWTAWASVGSGSPGYRTAVATRADVRQLLRGTGTVARTGQRSLQFGESGTVGSVTVSVGDHVRAGQLVATLSRAALRAAVTQAEAQQAKANATLSADLTAQTTSSAAAASAASAATPTPAASPSPIASPAPSRGQASGHQGVVTAAQSAVVQDQKAADEALLVAAAALDDQHGTCVVPDASDAAAVAACQSALDTVTAAQEKVAAAQHQVQGSIDALARLLSTGTTASASAPSTTVPSTSAPSTTSPSTTAPTASRSPATAARAAVTGTGAAPASSSQGSGATSGGDTVTAATLARDQSAIDTAHAGLIRARHSLASARLTSPVAGTVAAVGIAVGDQTAASDTGQVVLLSDDGQAEVTMDVAEADVRSVAVGQAAEVLADGSPIDLPGRVTSIGLLSSSASGTAAYPVTVSVAGAPPSMADGSQAAVSLVTKTVHRAVTVPTSAIHGSAASATVRMLSGGTVTTARVAVGAVGAERVQITSGVKPGQQVVLADLSEPLPTGDTGTSRFGGGGGFGSGSFGGGGPPGFTGTGQRVFRGS